MLKLYMRDLWIMRGYLPCENHRTREYHIVDYAGSFHWISDYLRWLEVLNLTVFRQAVLPLSHLGNFWNRANDCQQSAQCCSLHLTWIRRCLTLKEILSRIFLRFLPLREIFHVFSSCFIELNGFLNRVNYAKKKVRLGLKFFIEMYFYTIVVFIIVKKYLISLPFPFCCVQNYWLQSL